MPMQFEQYGSNETPQPTPRLGDRGATTIDGSVVGKDLTGSAAVAASLAQSLCVPDEVAFAFAVCEQVLTDSERIVAMLAPG